MSDKKPAEISTESSDNNLPKAYDPSSIEQRWADYWVRERLFEVPTPPTTLGAPHLGEMWDEESNRVPCRPTGGPREAGKGRANAFTMLLPPPNVTGYLHMGHMFEHTESDILMRWRRMSGSTAVWVPGTDHAGIATQMLVERQLKVEGTDRKALGREAFTERVWAWKRQYGSAITDQMRRLGASVDWSREYFTMDDRLNVAVREAFVRLYQQGLIYRGAYIVNWDPVQQTAVSDLEVTSEERIGKLYYIRYPFAGENNPGPFDDTNSITVATTRPETMLGDVAVAVNPNDERYRRLIGMMLQLPLTKREIPIIADDWAKPEFGTGAVKVTPAHDTNDFAIGQRHNLPSLTILDETAHIKVPGGSFFDGLDRFEARKQIVEQLEGIDVLVSVKDHPMTVPISQRSGAVIEPRLSMQWFLAVNKNPILGGDSICRKAILAVQNRHIQFTPENYTQVYFEWMNNLRDWCISRQLWWGHRIPAWYCDNCKAMVVARSQPTTCENCSYNGFTQETDVLDTWFSSGMLPFTVFGWPGEQKPQPTETIRGTAEGEGKYIRQTGGAGNFGHVRLRVAPNQPGEGFVFSNETNSQTLPEQFIQPIREGVQEAMRGGVLQGHPLVDIKVTLIDGSFHEVDSNEMAFRIAAGMALKEAARKALPITHNPSSNLEPAHLKAHGNLLTLDPTSNLEPRTSNLTPDLAAFYPTSQLVTGFDILFFWVARMIMLGVHFTLDIPMPDGSPRQLADAVPFRDVYIHALVRDANREKMSKTKGNVVDPIEIITKYGTDAVRFTLASMASPGTDIAFSEARTEGYRAFANKIWNAARFLFMNLDRARASGIEVELPKAGVISTEGGASAAEVERPPHFVSATSDSATTLPTTDAIESRWILARLSETAASANASLAEYRFDEAANTIYQFFWGDLCDWYLEIVKLRLNFEVAGEVIPTSDTAEESLAETATALTTLAAVFEASLRLLSPFMPFLTEEIWHALYAGLPPAKSIALTRYPQAADFACDTAALAEMQTLQELITTIRALRKELGVPEKESAPIRIHATARVLDPLEFSQDILARLARVEAIQVSADPLTGNNARSTANFDLAVVYEKKIDIPAERERLTKELAKHEKVLTANDARLADEKFIGKAPAHIVEGLRKQTAETRILHDKTRAALDALG